VGPRSEVRIQARREFRQANPFERYPEKRCRCRKAIKPLIPRCQEKPLSFSHGMTVPQTDTGRREENSKARE